MGEIITVNPVTRISGFLEIQVEIEKNKIIDAKSSGMLYRGFEKMLKGRPPLDAIYFSERICGICSAAHSIASSMALENVLNVEPDYNGKILRNLIHGSEFLQNHLKHFYLFTLPDFAKIPEIKYTYSEYNNDYRLPESLNKLFAVHYAEGVKYSRLAHEFQAILGGKAPHNHGNFVGGVTVNFDASKFIRMKSILDSILDFAENIMIPDVYTIAKYYEDYFFNGYAYDNLITYGVFDEFLDKSLFYVAPEVIINGQRHTFNSDYITENVLKAWYDSDSVNIPPTAPPLKENRSKEGAYTWIKAPRYLGYPMETGPLARMIISRNYDGGISTMDRYIARVLEVKKVAQIMEGLLERAEPKFANQGIYEFSYKASGKGLKDTTRGSLGHWIEVDHNSILNYGIITPSVWNLSPEDPNNINGVVEQALINTVINDTAYPVEIGRIVRSFDPCVSCATHVLGDKFNSVEIRVV